MTDPQPRDPNTRPPLLTLGALIRRGLHIDPEKPFLRHGHSGVAKRGEDFVLVQTDCLRVPGHPSTAFSVFGVFDGHNGVSAAVYTKDHLLEHVMSAIPLGIGREEWLKALPHALVAGFVKADIEFRRTGDISGTTVTFVVVDRWVVTVASVGDSRCVLDTCYGVVSSLTVDHRLEENAEERERVTASGGEVARLNIFGGQEVGPLRCWPGGLCLSRSIGDTDVGEFIVPIPHVKQVKLPNSGGRLIIASDGVWDALSSEVAAKSTRGLEAELAAKTVVKEALRTSGLKDDTTCLVVDLLPSEHSSLPMFPVKHQNKLKSLILGKWSQHTRGKYRNRSYSGGAVEEIFEEGSAKLDERLATNFPSEVDLSSSRCAICQTDQAPSEDLAPSQGSSLSTASTEHIGPYLCADCRKKKEAMEGKGPNRPIVSR